VTDTDPYLQCVTALMTAVRTLTTYFPKDYQVSFNHNDVNKGADNWFFCTPGAFPNTRLDGRQKIYQWQTDCDIYMRYATEEESIPKFIELRGAIVSLLHRPRVLKNIGVIRVSVATTNKLQQDISGPNPNFLIQAMVVTIEQIVSD